MMERDIMESRIDQNGKMKRLVLIVEDEYVNREILGSILEEEYNILFAEDGEEALNVISSNADTLSIVLLDLNMPKLNGFEVIKAMKNDSSWKKIPIIVLTSESTAEVESLRLGASDFITKPYDMPEVIVARVKRLIELSEDRLIIKAAERDDLTQLYTKSFFYQYCNLMDRFQPDIQMDAVTFNVDHFHLINEIYGRKFGDKVLEKIAELVKNYSHDHNGIAGRGEADTFFMYLNHLDDYSNLEKIIISEINKSYPTHHIHIRVGICVKDKSGIEIETLFDRSKLACNTLRSKFNQTCAYFDDEMKEKAFFNERLIHDINDGIENNQFKAFYQPKYDISGDKPALKGAEALVRWEHPEFNLVSPGSFITLFEENGLIELVDEYIWNVAADQLKKWKKSYKTDIAISVNVSRIDIFNPEIEDKLMKVIKNNKLEPKDIHIEITESAYSDNPSQIVKVVEKLRDKGFIIEMDDFGTGYSALNMLSSMPIDILKLDMQFVRTMLVDEKNLRMVEIVMQIARLLDVPVVAEGVETKEQLEQLKGMGCHIVQGYYFSKPVPAKDFEAFIKEDSNVDTGFFKKLWSGR